MLYLLKHKTLPTTYMRETYHEPTIGLTLDTANPS